MVLLDFILGVLFCVILWLPLVTGYCAYSYERSFWLWFTLGCTLPGLSFIVLVLLLWREQRSPGYRLVEEAKRILAEAAAQEVEEH
jgi:Trk-type K+ transport system membrane component